MEEKLYRIKPLKWLKINQSKYKFKAWVGDIGQGFYEISPSGTKKGWFCLFSSFWEDAKFYESIEEAKQAAESHYRERLMMCLDEVATIEDRFDGGKNIVFKEPLEIKSGNINLVVHQSTISSDYWNPK